MKKVDIFLESVKNIKTVGTIMFSSKFLVKKMVDPIDFAKADCIVELGAGNGCITEGLIERMTADAKLLSFEINEQFFGLVNEKITDERLVLINDSAEKIAEYLQAEGFEKADHIVSAVPLIVLPQEVSDRIVEEALKCLKPGGLFIQLSYSPLQGKRFENQFDNMKINFTMFNLPPAFVYICQKAA
ncbi:MAG: class I SAM-dependent methyltransferase [Chitinophagales bacterium]